MPNFSKKITNYFYGLHVLEKYPSNYSKNYKLFTNYGGTPPYPFPSPPFREPHRPDGAVAFPAPIVRKVVHNGPRDFLLSSCKASKLSSIESHRQLYDARFHVHIVDTALPSLQTFPNILTVPSKYSLLLLPTKIAGLVRIRL